MPIRVDPGGASVIAHPPTFPARADEAKADTTEPVAAQLGDVGSHSDRDDAARMEHVRQSRPRRWQEQR